MGVYDTVIIKCPKCGEEHDFQSKSGTCILGYYTLDNCPEDVVHDINRHSPYECECGGLLSVNIDTKKILYSRKNT